MDSKFRFNFKEDLKYFETLFAGIKNTLIFFDFRNPIEKRNEYRQLRKKILAEKIKESGFICQLQYQGVCDVSSGITLDHVIPLSSNVLNKALRGMKPNQGKKVPAESYGSNHPHNLILACMACNAHKKHRMPNREEIIKLFRLE
jgi:5-methylcytosine-specific restriction endonuclease McrA